MQGLQEFLDIETGAPGLPPPLAALSAQVKRLRQHGVKFYGLAPDGGLSGVAV